ncbi:fumarylacetoacetate hydrolase family protein [Variovorax guangxiensis]|uniref:fumarylacetoacetate hydrolase family protein n=1 Tax=Variovorax guangxiensis TaxID=1775474 RepID=UPI002855BF55|nr:fumarylacetoacetate hydrolase family protein [Variovorax guangxiensis]MDR6860758.1 2-keto-4-pentenoate hydratase/2-oxohepta-3-ene-1,7-dioic acid hydratase in catechol pathway [Variovorax guangxiensis]
MKLVRFGARGSEKPGVIDAQGVVRDLSGVVPDIDARTLSPAALTRLREIDFATLPAAPAGVRLGACVGSIPNLVCIGLNYSDHAAETDTPIPSQPIVFNKHTGAAAGPHDALILAPGSAKLDWEVELAVVIGTPAWHVREEDALRHVAGYCLCNDVSERAWQLEYEGQWTKGKSYYGYAPLGPWLVTADEVPDPQDVDLWLEVNGVRRQSGNTRTQIFGVAHIVSYLSRFMALAPGDVIATGTPPGVGLGHKPPLFLKAGDRVTLGSSLLGEQRQSVVVYDDEAMGARWREARLPQL